MPNDAMITYIHSLNESEAVTLARALIYAEAGRLGLPTTHFSMSGRVQAADQGIDGRSNFALGSGALLPLGPCVWQVKSGVKVPSATTEFDPDKHGALIKAIKNGSDYVLFWTKDVVDPTRQTVTDKFTQAVGAIRPRAKVHVLFADNIESFCFVHMAILALNPAAPLRGVLTFDRWGLAKKFREIEYKSDDVRAEMLAAIRYHVRTEDPEITSINLYGDTGVGKSRLVFEALAADDIAPRVIVARDPHHLDPHLLSSVIQSDNRRMVLVVDDCTADQRRQLVQDADMARGRIRLITVGARYTREAQPADSGFLDLGPLEIAACKEIALAEGVGPEIADRIASLTEGYPKLASVLAAAIRHGGPGAEIGERIRGERVGSVLATMLDDERDIAMLGVLSLFERLGFDDGLSEETVIACEAFGLDEREFRRVVRRETGRFVSAAGRYRQVTPLLFAVWLATKRIRKEPRFSDILKQLPESLRDRIIDQMKSFAGDSVVSDALKNVIDARSFSLGVLEGVDEGSARLIHVAAIVDPPLGLEAIERIVHGRSIDELRSGLVHGRRSLVYALEVLLWFEETFERAADILVQLALAENEHWSNNSVGILQGVFRVHLGGTGASYDKRLHWARRAFVEFPESIRLIVPAIGVSFNPHETRIATDFASRTAPPEWRPESVDQEIATRRQAWQFLMELAADDAYRDLVGEAVAGNLRSAVLRGLLEDVLEDVPSFGWSTKVRVAMNESLGNAIEYDGLPDSVLARLAALRSFLIGSAPEDRLRYLFQIEGWRFHDYGIEKESEAPELLEEIAGYLVGQGLEYCISLANRLNEGSPGAVSTLYDKLAGELDFDERLVYGIDELPEPSEEALIGAFAGLARQHGDAWATSFLTRWLNPRRGHLVVRAAHTVQASKAIARLSIEAVQEGIAQRSDLRSFLYGAWTRALPEHSVARIVDVLGSSTDVHDIEHALGIGSQWLDDHDDVTLSELQDVLKDLLQQSARVRDTHSAMLSLYREKVSNRISLPPVSRRDVLVAILSKAGRGARSSDLGLLDQLTREDPQLAVEVVLTAVLGDGPEDLRGLWLEDEHLLSRVASAAPEDVMRSALDAVPADRWRELVSHIDFGVSRPNWLIDLFVGAETDDVTRARAAYAFMYPARAYWDLESSYITTRRDAANEWLKDPGTPTMTTVWLRDVIAELNARIEKALLSEAEER